jgi:hypothetical protein
MAAESTARRTVTLKGILEGTTSWVHVYQDGRMELEYFDCSEAAQNHFGNDVAWIYRVDAADVPRVRESLSVANDEAMLADMVERFGDVKKLRDFLKEKEIPFQEEFDSWA